MKVAAALLLVVWQVAAGPEPPVATPQHMRYERAIALPPGQGQACAVLDAEIFPHAAPSLRDLRLFADQDAKPREVPYAITLSETINEDTVPASVLNLGASSGATIVFDLEMPERPYTDVILDLSGQDFLATATVTGSNSLGGVKGTSLGVFTLFDLTSQHLSRDTTLPLVESTFKYLHVALAVVAAPGSAAARFVPAMVTGAHVPPSREAQTIYTTVARVTAATTGALAAPRTTRFDFALPLRVPVERVSFDLPPSYTGNFSRDVKITASPDVQPESAANGVRAEPALETVSGTISRVNSTQSGHRIHEVEMSVPATLGANLQGVAHVRVEIENGDDQPLPVAAVRLEMRERRLCFDAPAAGSAAPTLYYGDPQLRAPVYDYERLFIASDKPLAAALGPEQLNAAYTAPVVPVRPFTERHPEVLWIALIGVVCVLGVVALRSSRNVGV